MAFSCRNGIGHLLVARGVFYSGVLIGHIMYEFHVRQYNYNQGRGSIHRICFLLDIPWCFLHDKTVSLTKRAESVLLRYFQKQTSGTCQQIIGER